MAVAKTEEKPAHFMIAAGGTGGHMFPAHALAQELERRGARVDLITDERGHRYGSTFPASQIYEVPAASLSLRPSLRNIIGIFKIIRGTLKAQRILHQAQPIVLIGFGGYPTLPPLAGSLLQGMVSLLHEQNAVMGRVNRLFARFATAIATGFPKLRGISEQIEAKITFVGNPVRDEVRALANAPYNPPEADGVFNLLVFGGSQGAHVFSEVVPGAIADLPDSLRKKMKIVQQCRVEDMEQVREIYAQAGVNAEVSSFFNRLPQRMSEAHLVIARAGASTVSELAVIGRPAILVPLPGSLDGDQLYNARYFVDTGGGWLLDQRDLNVERLSALVMRLRYSTEELKAAAAGAAAIGKPDAVLALADLAEDLAAKLQDDEANARERNEAAWPAIEAAKQKPKPKTKELRRRA